MPTTAAVLTTLGALLLCGLLAALLGRRTPLPRVTLLLLVGLAIGPAGLDLLPDLSLAWFDAVATMALAMVGFLMGGGLTPRELAGHGRAVLAVSVAVTAATALVVGLGLSLLGVDLAAALVLATVATATAPAATAAVVREERRDGSFARTLLGVVAVDDVWGLVLFGLVLAGLPGADGQVALGPGLAHAAWEVGGAVLVGVVLGVPMALATGRLEPGEPTQAEALAGVLLCGGIALWLGVSHLLASVVLGAVVANLAAHHNRPFAAIEGIEWPFLTLFFLLAGASLELESLADAGLVGACYLLLRTLGRLVGGAVGGRVGGLAPAERRWVGVALLPQAGVAIGMTLAVTHRRPDLVDTVLPVVLGATAAFELAGPPLTRLALSRVAAARVVESGGSPSQPGRHPRP